MHCNDWFADDCIALKGTYTDIESCRVEWLGQTLDIGAILIGWHTYRLPGLIFLAFLGFINLGILVKSKVEWVRQVGSSANWTGIVLRPRPSALSET